MRRAYVLPLGALLVLAGCDVLGPSDPAPTITSIAPATVMPGDTATIRGENFSAQLSENQVTVGGEPAAVLTASETELRVVVPGGEDVSCAPAVNLSFVVTVNGRRGSADHPVGAGLRTLTVGESVRLDAAEALCSELTGGATYLISVFNTSAVPTGQTGFLLRGRSPTAAADVTSQPTQIQRSVAAPPASTQEVDPHTAAHQWILEQNVRLGRELSARVTPRRRDAAQALAVAAAPVGTTRTFRIPDVSTHTFCAVYREVTARAVYSGSTAVIWEDEAAPLSGQMDTRWQQLGLEYEEVMHPILLENFGDPLTYDPWLANPGRLNMLFSPEVNGFLLPGGGAPLAFVISGDLFPRSACGSSDETAIFYGRVPTVLSGSGYTVSEWEWTMRSTLIHEVKHILSFATRLRIAAEGVRNPVYESMWLEESTARLSEEFYARALAGYGQGGNVTYQESIWCERRAGPQCGAIPLIIHKHFGDVYAYYRNVHNRSPVGRAVAGDFTFYGSGWLLVRWAMDHSTLSEAAFTRALITEPQLTGVSNLAARAGRSFPAMLGDFTLAMMLDDYPGGLNVRPELTFPSWNTRDIMNGLHEDYKGTGLAMAYPVAWPLDAHALTFGNFDAGVSIRGGTASFFQLTGPAGGNQLLQLLNSAGGSAPSNLGVAIVRVN
jgi:hypothetical protein